MHGRTTPSALAARATALWNQEADLDQRSARYAEADRLAANGDLAGRGANKRASNWVTALTRYEGFWRESGRTPRENTRNRASLPAAERRLGEWSRYQRRFEDNLCRYQKIRLDISPAFSWDPLEHEWQLSLGKCIRHVQEMGRLPYLNAADPAEFALARWLGRQLRQLQAGTLPESRTAHLAALLRLPGVRADSATSRVGGLSARRRHCAPS
jgi:hypothetical protein